MNWGDVPERDEFARHFTITVRPEDKRKINPYELKKVIKTITGQYPESITTSGREAFAAKVTTREQSQKMVSTTRIGNVDCKVEKHKYFNQRKGLIFIYEFDLENIEEFMKGLQEEYNISTVEQVTFIKPKSPQTKVCLLTFEQEYLPEYICIPGERSDARVILFKPRPKLCRQCWQ